jgi:NTE family protein
VSVENAVGIPSFFDGVPIEVAAQILERLETRRFPAGSVVVAEGDSPRQMYLAESGTADVVVGERRVGSVQPGTTIGEMSFFTGEPASATVRTVDELVVHVISERELERIAAAHPHVYRNLAAMLAGRLARTNRLAAEKESGKLVLVRGGPALVAFALACSIAWHSREPTALLVVGDAPELEPFAAGNGAARSRAAVIFDRSASDSGIAARVESLSGSYAHVLVLASGATPPALAGAQVAELPGALELAAADKEALRSGVLPSTTAAGRALGRLARQVAALTVGLALGAGSLRGYAHVGVLRGLARVGIEPDVVSGTSIGSAVAAAHLCGNEPAEIVRLLDGSARTLFKPRVPVRSFLASAPLGRYLREAYEGKRIEELPRPFGIVAADLPTHREVVLRRGILWRAVLASMSIPGVFPAQRMGSLTLVDGGVVNAVPASVAAEMGATTVLAVRLMSFPDVPDMETEATERSAPPPSALSAILRAFEIMQARTARESAGGAATVTITPKMQEIRSSGKLRNFADGSRYVEAGEAALEAALPRIGSVLPWMRT